ncbi:hypothetical protein H0I23_08295 [Cellulophaga sp. HaHaR_3_176]|nr:hypothetical protein [Cellulophaga sp. HaHaR_3_176]QWX85700.1 hypothetical protein H0I23_08295 [Cellulophaga sp. HaHaR_3_176]
MRLKGFKLRTNTSFKYVPRYMEDEGVDNPYKFDSKFTKYKNSPIAGDFRSTWGDARKASRNKGNREINFRLIVIIAVLFLIVLWFFDFDLSMFTRF